MPKTRTSFSTKARRGAEQTFFCLCTEKDFVLFTMVREHARWYRRAGSSFDVLGSEAVWSCFSTALNPNPLLPHQGLPHMHTFMNTRRWHYCQKARPDKVHKSSMTHRLIYCSAHSRTFMHTQKQTHTPRAMQGSL